MPAAVQRRQHARIVEAAGCVNRTDVEVMACLRKLSINLLGKLWWAEPKGSDHGVGTAENPSWLQDNLFDLPRHRDGLRLPGLAVVDGDIVREPVEQALAMGRNDVPVIISSMAQEGGFFPGEKFDWALTPEEFQKRLQGDFAFMSPDLGDDVAKLYASQIGVSAQMAFETIAADIEMACGNLALALAASRGFRRGPVYLVYNEQHGEGIFHNLAWAYHGADLAAASTGTGEMASELRSAWHEFAATGRVAAWQPVGSVSPWVSMRLQNNGTRASAAWKLKECQFWKENGFGKEFWWSN